jgi:hypothetical protein
MDNETMAMIISRYCLILVLYVLSWVPDRVKLIVDRDRFLSAFSYSTPQGTTQTLGTWPLGPQMGRTPGSPEDPNANRAAHRVEWEQWHKNACLVVPSLWHKYLLPAVDEDEDDDEDEDEDNDEDEDKDDDEDKDEDDDEDKDKDDDEDEDEDNDEDEDEDNDEDKDEDNDEDEDEDDDEDKDEEPDEDKEQEAPLPGTYDHLALPTHLTACTASTRPSRRPLPSDTNTEVW